MSDLSSMLDAVDAARANIQPVDRPAQLVRTVKFNNISEIARPLAEKCMQRFFRNYCGGTPETPWNCTGCAITSRA